jgi:hypothetical protein
MAILKTTINKINNPFLRGIFVFLVFTFTAIPVAVGTYAFLPGPTEGVSGVVGVLIGYGAALATYHAGMWGKEEQQGSN